MASVDAWRERLRELKDMEDNVGTIMRDREILYVSRYLNYN